MSRRFDYCMLLLWIIVGLPVLGYWVSPSTKHHAVLTRADSSVVCRASLSTISSDRVRFCDDLPVSMNVEVGCEQPPLHVVFALLSIVTDVEWLSTTTIGILNEIRKYQPARVGTIEYASSIETVTALTSDLDRIEKILKKGRQVGAGHSPVEKVSKEALLLFQAARPDPAQASVAPREILVLITSSKQTSHGRADVARAAQLMREAGVGLLIGCPFKEVSEREIYCRGLEEMVPPAQVAQYYSEPPNNRRLPRAMQREIQLLPTAAKLKVIEVSHHLPPMVDFQVDSASQPPTSVTRTITGTQLTWTWPNPPPTSAYSLTYTTRPLAEGTGAITGETILTHADGSRQRFPMPSRPITVSGLCITPTDVPTATATSAPTQAPTATPSPSATSTSTPIPTATPTPLPGPLYLPLALHERCLPEVRRVDVALVIDASSSMDEPAPGGGTKLAAAVAAARGFLGQLRFDRGDQASVLAFNAEARLLGPLSADRAALDAALAGIQTAPQTCLVCAVDAAWNELAGPRHAPNHAAVLVLLTDGRSNPRPVAEAVARAEAAKAAGVTIYTIGLGTDLESDALAAMASRPEGYFHAPDADVLAGIYAQIAVALPCPPVAFWGGR